MEQRKLRFESTHVALENNGYLNKESSDIKEAFPGFVPIQDQIGKNLTETIVKLLVNLGINVEHLCGHGYDGASSMAGKNEWSPSLHP